MSEKPKIEMTSLDVLFGDDEPSKPQLGVVTTLPLTELHCFKDHPFKVKDDEEMAELAESIKQYGVLVPALVRPRTEDGYEIIAGHRRHHSCKLAGLEEMTVIISDMTDDEAIIVMVDSNIQRQNILPSEKAFAYKMKMEAMSRQGYRADLESDSTSRQNVGKFETADIIGEKSGDDGRTVQRYINLTKLIPELLEMVDNKKKKNSKELENHEKMLLTVGFELSSLTETEQEMLFEVIQRDEISPSQQQAVKLKKQSEDGKLTPEVMDLIMEKDEDFNKKVTISDDFIKKHFPSSYTPQKVQETVKKLIEDWAKKRKKELDK